MSWHMLMRNYPEVVDLARRAQQRLAAFRRNDPVSPNSSPLGTFLDRTVKHVGDLLAATLRGISLTPLLTEVAIPESYPLWGGCGVQRGVEPPVPFDVFGVKRGRKVAQLLRQLGSPSLCCRSSKMTSVAHRK